MVTQQKHKLDRPELREKIETLQDLGYWAIVARFDNKITIEEVVLYTNYITDQILVLISDDKEACLEVIKRTTARLEKMIQILKGDGNHDRKNEKWIC